MFVRCLCFYLEGYEEIRFLTLAQIYVKSCDVNKIKLTYEVLT